MTTFDRPGGLLAAGQSAPTPVTAWVQPIVALTTGTVAGYEALARFPDQRVPVTAVFERAWSIGRGPATEAMALDAALSLPGRPASAYLAVNVSPRAMEASVVRTVLDRDLTGVMVEITEAHYLPTGELAAMAAWLRERGARLATDDVGTGYAGLERLLSLRPDLIKLDRSLTQQLPDDRVTRLMVESLVRFAARSGSAVCAEGIETAELLEVVAELDIAYGQGFFFGQPRPGWASLSAEVTAAAVAVHQQALSGTPKQAAFLDDFLLRTAQILVSDGHADAAAVERLWAMGYGGLLLVPVITRGLNLGILSFYRRQPVPWTLAQIRLARIGASQLAATLDRLLQLAA